MLVLPAIVGDLAPGIVGAAAALIGYVGFRIEKSKRANQLGKAIVAKEGVARSGMERQSFTGTKVAGHVKKPYHVLYPTKSALD